MTLYRVDLRHTVDGLDYDASHVIIAENVAQAKTFAKAKTFAITQVYVRQSALYHETRMTTCVSGVHALRPGNLSDLPDVNERPGSGELPESLACYGMDRE